MTAANAFTPPSTANKRHRLAIYGIFVVDSAARRFGAVCQNAVLTIIALLVRFPAVRADGNFTARPAADPEELEQTQGDITAMIGMFDWKSWTDRGAQIRHGQTRASCIGNLSLALSQVGPLTSYSSSGASGALSLLPTAGALIGAPAKELWVLYKLMPMAGVFSMLLSLGGNIVPMNDTDYEVSSSAFTYGGLIATEKRTKRANGDARRHTMSPAEIFAEDVVKRANKTVTPTKRGKIAAGMFSQGLWFTILMFACFLTQSGGVVAWWCKAWGWMYFWYLMVAMSSLLENLAGVPFTKQWTIRVSKAPKLRISDGAPLVLERHGFNASGQLVTAFAPGHPDALLGGQVIYTEPQSTSSLMHDNDTMEQIRPVTRTDSGMIGHSPSRQQTSDDSNDRFVPRKPLPGAGYEDGRRERSLSQTHRERGAYASFGKSHGSVVVAEQPLTPELSRTYTEPEMKVYGSDRNILQDLETGFNTNSKVFMDPDEPYTTHRSPFMVIVSLRGISKPHAALRVVSKAISVGVFAAGTALFASTALITISVALTTLCLVLAVGVFGRVAALWMASEMMTADPVLHRVVDTSDEAKEYIEAILRQPGLIFELTGHVIIDGRAVHRYSRWFNKANFFGVLAPPFDVSKIAINMSRQRH